MLLRCHISLGHNNLSVWIIPIFVNYTSHKQLNGRLGCLKIGSEQSKSGIHLTSACLQFYGCDLCLQESTSRTGGKGTLSYGRTGPSWDTGPNRSMGWGTPSMISLSKVSEWTPVLYWTSVGGHWDVCYTYVLKFYLD